MYRGLLLIVALELMQAQVWLVWLLEHTDDRPWLCLWLITKYGPSVGRATGFLTWFVYIAASLASTTAAED